MKAAFYGDLLKLQISPILDIGQYIQKRIEDRERKLVRESRWDLELLVILPIRRSSQPVRSLSYTEKESR